MNSLNVGEVLLCAPPPWNVIYTIKKGSKSTKSTPFFHHVMAKWLSLNFWWGNPRIECRLMLEKLSVASLDHGYEWLFNHQLFWGILHRVNNLENLLNLYQEILTNVKTSTNAVQNGCQRMNVRRDLTTWLRTARRAVKCVVQVSSFWQSKSISLISRW